MKALLNKQIARTAGIWAMKRGEAHEEERAAKMREVVK